MNNLNTLATIIAIKDGQRTYPRLRRKLTKPEAIAEIIGLPLCFVAIGIIPVLWVLIDFLWTSKTVRVQNMSNGETFNMSRTEYKKYLAAVKDASKQTMTADDLLTNSTAQSNAPTQTAESVNTVNSSYSTEQSSAQSVSTKSTESDDLN